jgi:hypothetical protein
MHLNRPAFRDHIGWIRTHLGDLHGERKRLDEAFASFRQTGERERLAVAFTVWSLPFCSNRTKVAI